MSHLAPDQAPHTGALRRRAAPWGTQPSSQPAPLTAQHPWFSRSIPTIRSLADGQPGFTQAQSIRDGLSLLRQGSRDRPGSSPGSAGLQTSRDGTLALQPLHAAGPKGSQNELCQRLPHLLPQAVSPRRGVSLFGPSRSPTKVQGAGSVRREGPQFPAWHCLHCVAQVSIPRWSCQFSSPALGHTADPGCQQWAVPALRKGTRPSPSRPLTTHRRRESRQRMKPA